MFSELTVCRMRSSRGARIQSRERRPSAVVYSGMRQRRFPLLLAASYVTAAACGAVVVPAPSTRPAAAPVVAGGLRPGASLSPTQRRWVDSTLGTLTLRERVGQMVMVWVLGDYTNTRDSSYAEVIRWVERDR